MVLRLALLMWSAAASTSAHAADPSAALPDPKGAPRAEVRPLEDGVAEKDAPVAEPAEGEGAKAPEGEAAATGEPKAEEPKPHRARPTGPVPGDDTPAREARDPVEEGIWAWLERIDGEILPEKAVEQISTDAEAKIVERAVEGKAGGVDVPVDFYNDPQAAVQGDPLHLDEIDPSEFDIPIDINEHVIAKLRMFLGPHRKYIEKWLERKSRYEPMIMAELERRGLPKDLIYLSMIESGFNPYAYSSAQAAGLWQFIPSTGQYYGLDIDWWVDERRDPEKATHAALQMLGELHKQFGDWRLAFASYNTGPGRVRSALANAKATDPGADYWDLVDRDLLHSETQGYVPKIVAAAIIGHHPERYGFTNLKPEPELEYDTVPVQGVVDVLVLAECAGIDEEAFRMLNPAIRRYATPEGTSEIRVPKGKAIVFSEALAKVPPEERLQLVKHQVRRGETVSIIASRYGVSSSEIIRVNGIRNPNQIEVGQLLVVPLRGASGASSTSVATAVITSRPAPEPVAKTSSSSSGSSDTSSSSTASTHKVRSGETLVSIAERYHVSLSDLQKWNGIGNASHIEVGQVLKVRSSGTSSGASTSSSSSSAPAAAAPAKPLFTYTVRSGDTLALIAERYKVGLSDLAKWNGIRDADEIEVGTSLKFFGGKAPSSSSSSSSSSPSYYKIRSGDTLSAIADRYNVKLSDLQRWNGIGNASSIRVGQTLKIYKGSGPSTATTSSSTSSWTTYTVRSGDSLGAIADRYGVSVSELRSWNRLSGSTIFPGQKLKVKTK
jgi:membrane-bound lytic murein transglycosylase D